MPTIAQLADELVTLVKGTDAAKERVYSVFNTDDMETFAANVGFPAAGVSYEGCTPHGNTVKPAAGRAVSGQAGAVIATLHFSVIVVDSYRYGSTTDTKPAMTNLLDQIRQAVIGHYGVSKRPWVYVGELPLETELEGAIMYGQMWDTSIPVTGS